MKKNNALYQLVRLLTDTDDNCQCGDCVFFRLARERYENNQVFTEEELELYYLSLEERKQQAQSMMPTVMIPLNQSMIDQFMFGTRESNQEDDTSQDVILH